MTTEPRCEHTEHATRGDGRYGRHFETADPAGAWEPCPSPPVSAAAPDCRCGHPAPCPECGPGYRYGDDGCRHTPAVAPDERGLPGVWETWQRPGAHPSVASEYAAMEAGWTAASAALSAELAEAKAEARRESNRADQWMRAHDNDLAEAEAERDAARAEAVALRARIEGLVNEYADAIPGFVRRLRAALAARPTPTVSAADVEYAIDGAIPDDLYGYRERYTRHAARRVLALLRHGDADHPSGCLTVADEGERAGR